MNFARLHLFLFLSLSLSLPSLFFDVRKKKFADHSGLEHTARLHHFSSRFLPHRRRRHHHFPPQPPQRLATLVDTVLETADLLASRENKHAGLFLPPNANKQQGRYATGKTDTTTKGGATGEGKDCRILARFLVVQFGSGFRLPLPRPSVP